MIFAYNKEQVGDVLFVLVKNDEGQDVDVERHGKIARVFLSEPKQTVGWNIFEASSILPTLVGNGQVWLSDEQVEALNLELAREGFEESIENDTDPKFVIGFVKELTPHPDSDHLNIAQIDIGEENLLQIVAGAPNIEQGQFVVVAKIGAMMPNGSIIWDGELRGVPSHGMLCSPRELHLKNAPDVRGILVLSKDEATIGEAFSPEKHWKG